jgi:hypothetical protein
MARMFATTTLEDEAVAYQSRMGGDSPKPTLDDIKRSQQPRKSHSRVSYSSRKSGTSSRASKTGDVQIKTGDTVLHITGDAKIELRQGEDGEQTFIIGTSSSGRESSYNGSNGSGSRVGRSRAGSRLRRRDTIHEEDGYEPGI